MTQWQRVQEGIRAMLRQQGFEPGSRLPTEKTLAARFGVHRHTLRRAIAGLVEEGLIRTEQGSGMFVEERVLDYPIGRRTRFTETVERQNRSRGRRIIETRIETPSSRVVRALGLRANSKALYLLSISEVDGRPMSISHNWFHRHRCAGITRHVKQTPSITEALRRCGVEDYFREVTRVTTNMPRADEARLLRQPANRPVLISESIDVDESGEPICFGRTVWAGDRVQLNFVTGI